jgi:DNA-binding CsgD family transcriptional regulator
MSYALTSNESRRLMRLAARLSQPSPCGVLADSVVADDMLQLFNADFIGSTRWNPEASSFEAAHCVGRDPGMADQYVRHFQFIDPISPVLRRRRGASHIHAAMRRDELHRTAYFNEFLKPFRTVEGVDLYVYRGHRNVGDVRVWRAGGRAPLGEREITLLNLLRPYLLNAMITPRSATASSVDGLMQSLQQHRWPCFLLDGDAKAEANDAARRLLRSLSPPQQEALQHRLRTVASISRPVRWSEFTLCVLRLADTQTALVQLVPMEPAHGSQAVRSERFGLTPREAQICELLVKGMTDHEIGRLLRLGYWTVRTHLQHVFAKLEVSNRVELTHRLLAEEREHNR